MPQTIVDLAQSGLLYPLAEQNGFYDANVDNMTISLSRSSNILKFSTTENEDIPI